MKTVLEFRAEIQIIGVNPYVLVDVAQANSLHPMESQWRKPMPVVVQVNGKPHVPWHINMMPVGDGDFYLYLHNDIRKASDTKVGDSVDVKVWFDEIYRNGPQHDLPQEFSDALNKNQAAAAHWAQLPPSKQKEIVRYFAGLKSPEALQRNIVRATDVLEGNPGHFLGRDWVDGR
jgi:hypothetical protein